jgi:phosphoribosylformimino-5-aminoimidazole carboxamide ribotide isomerase
VVSSADPLTAAETAPLFLEEEVGHLDQAGRAVLHHIGLDLGFLSTSFRADAASVADQAVALGVRRLLVLDLARVGTGKGTGTEGLCARLAARHPGVELSAGGGVRDLSDLRRLRDCGVQAALVAQALHEGVLRRADLQGL